MKEQAYVGTVVAVVQVTMSRDTGWYDRFSTCRRVDEVIEMDLLAPSPARTVGPIVLLGGRNDTRWFDKLEVGRHVVG